jgi:hypothetical protein
MKAETISKIMERGYAELGAPDTPVLAAFIAEKLNEIDAVHSQVKAINKEHEKRLKEWEAYRAALDTKIDDVRSKCPHWATTHSTGTAEAGSYTACDTCGMRIE